MANDRVSVCSSGGINGRCSIRTNENGNEIGNETPTLLFLFLLLLLLQFLTYLNSLIHEGFVHKLINTTVGGMGHE